MSSQSIIWFSSIFVGSFLATIAELVFLTQWYLFLDRVTKATNEQKLNHWVQFLIPMIFFAKFCSWYAVISTHYLGNSIEESTWALTYALIGNCDLSLTRSLLMCHEKGNDLWSVGFRLVRFLHDLSGCTHVLGAVVGAYKEQQSISQPVARPCRLKHSLGCDLRYF